MCSLNSTIKIMFKSYAIILQSDYQALKLQNSHSLSPTFPKTSQDAEKSFRGEMQPQQESVKKKFQSKMELKDTKWRMYPQNRNRELRN